MLMALGTTACLDVHDERSDAPRPGVRHSLQEPAAESLSERSGAARILQILRHVSVADQQQLIGALNQYIETVASASPPECHRAHTRLLQTWKAVLPPLQVEHLQPLLPERPAEPSTPPEPLRVSPHEEPLSRYVDAFVPDRVIIGFHGAIPGRIASPDQRGEAEMLRRFERQNAALYALPDGSDTLGWIRALRQTNAFAYVEPEQIGGLSGAVDDPRRSEQWNFDDLSAEEAWDLSTGAGVVVAVIDTGIIDGGPDGIHGLLEGYDYFSDDADTTDEFWHGTHVAGTIAQNTGNGIGVAGLAWNAEIMPIKVTDENADTSTSVVVDGINHAIDNGADVINMSAGFREYSALIESAAADAYNSGIFFAAAVGNDSSMQIDFPAANDGVVAVSSIGPSHELSSIANYGSELDLVAPGEDILQELFTWRRGYASDGYFRYGAATGTSMAAPHVAAAAALLMSVGASHEEAEQYLTETALDLGDADRDDTFGHGLIRPHDALEAYLSDRRQASCEQAGAGAQSASDHFDLATVFADAAL